MNSDVASLVATFRRTRAEDAFRRLHAACAPRLRGFALRLAGGEATTADDVCQETWVRAITLLDRFHAGASFHGWLAGIALNCWREQLRLDAREVPGGEGMVHVPDRLPSPDSQLDAAILRATVDGLPPGYRAAVVLHDIEGYRHEEIARMQGITVGTSKSQLSKARRLLRVRLGQQGKE